MRVSARASVWLKPISASCWRSPRTCDGSGEPRRRLRPDGLRIARLNELIAGHFREHLPVEFYARELGISVTHLNRITKAQTGKTMNDLLSEKNVSQAKRDLVFTVKTAQKSPMPWASPIPLISPRFFARETGETPRQFREQERARQQSHSLAAE